MKTNNRIFFVAWTVVAILVGFGLGAVFLLYASPASADELRQEGPSEGPPEGADTETNVPEKYIHRAELAVADAIKTIYYFPLDSNNHNTLLFFHNTTTITSTIDLDFQDDSGAACLSGVTFDLPPGESARVSADPLDPGRPASWADTIVYNMFDTCEIGLISMPDQGVYIEGYVAWTATDIYNPRELNPHAPIRFSTDPYTIFFPLLNTP